MVNHIVCRYLIKEPSCTHYFCLFNWSKLHRFHRALSLCNKENMLNCSFIERDCPIRAIMSNRRWYRESFRKLCIYTYFRRSIQVFCKFTFYTLISITISKYIWLYMFLCFKCFIYCCMLLSCKYFTIILTFKLVIRNI